MDRRSIVLIACVAACIPLIGAQPESSSRIIGAQIADGTGAPLRRADVRIVGDTITEIGTITPRSADRVVEATGLVLAPGVIDTHNHSTEGLDTDPDAVTQISQGITTLVVGQDGSSPFPLRDYLAKRRASPSTVNVAIMVGHATLRRQVMRDDFRRTATPAEIKRLEELVEQRCSWGQWDSRPASNTKWAATPRLRKWSQWRASPPRWWLLHFAHSRRSRQIHGRDPRSDRRW